MRYAALAALLLTLALPVGAAEVAVPDGYRMDDYRAPTPPSAPGAITLDTMAAAALWRSGRARWFDVLPAARRPAGLPAETLWRPPPRLGIPGSIWLPEVGRGRISSAQEAWLRDNVVAATGGDQDSPIVFYCLAECWMSWNAARRVAAWGWRAVYWYAEGTDGWEAAGLPTEALHPAPGAP
ncbi:rhodanese-like domain-containing protein [Roseomonas marmotae]|uniref:PQQ-dependent catabolism-associated CXXCW motif protein n=1 Tax=Roseomonas marmotae TaxID=2768161 RepID=A0ABS3KDK9_9PROT|nr:rhodanese-like domain-containing protein [Roseomonas marmotae]MBO1075549.1 PQQ-dependent catabolism-associated CXXCW motif protein [Roseomonas marmotae]QTI81538.1 PQQ-dependent catabolism-associated CXXCW motif protein [Roseomonas marmotae]